MNIPARATSWSIREVKKLAQEQGVAIYEADQCIYVVEVEAIVTPYICSHQVIVVERIAPPAYEHRFTYVIILFLVATIRRRIRTPYLYRVLIAYVQRPQRYRSNNRTDRG